MRGVRCGVSKWRETWFLPLAPDAGWAELQSDVEPPIVPGTAARVSRHQFAVSGRRFRGADHGAGFGGGSSSRPLRSIAVASAMKPNIMAS
jgi:hypothetical protein